MPSAAAMASNPLTATFSDSLLVMTSSRPASMPDEASKPASVIITLWQDETHHWQRWQGQLFGRLYPGKGGTGRRDAERRPSRLALARSAASAGLRRVSVERPRSAAEVVAYVGVAGA